MGEGDTHHSIRSVDLEVESSLRSVAGKPEDSTAELPIILCFVHFGSKMRERKGWGKECREWSSPKNSDSSFAKNRNDGPRTTHTTSRTSENHPFEVSELVFQEARSLSKKLMLETLEALRECQITRFLKRRDRISPNHQHSPQEIVHETSTVFRKLIGRAGTGSARQSHSETF